MCGMVCLCLPLPLPVCGARMWFGKWAIISKQRFDQIRHLKRGTSLLLPGAPTTTTTRTTTMPTMQRGEISVDFVCVRVWWLRWHRLASCSVSARNENGVGRFRLTNSDDDVTRMPHTLTKTKATRALPNRHTQKRNGKYFIRARVHVAMRAARRLCAAAPPVLYMD